MAYRSPAEIAQDIHSDYMDRGKNVPESVRAYLEPAKCLSSWDHHYYSDDAVTVMIYLLSNLGGWRGETARQVKAEIKAGLRDKGLKV
jgi:hypothetical protein